MAQISEIRGMASNDPKPAQPGKRGKVLLIHPPGKTMDLLHSLLTHDGYRTAEAETSKEGARMLDADRHVDCIVADLRLACGGSFHFIRVIKSSPRLRKLPILLTTQANPDRALVLQAIEQGVAGVIILPADRETLMTKISKAIGGGRPRILVVDDDDMIRDLLTNVLEIERFAVTTCESADDALKVLAETRVSAVVTDMLMPGMSGIDLIKKLHVEQPQLPVLLITGYSGYMTPRDIIKAGAAGYFSKPFKNTELVTVLRKALERGSSSTEEAPGATPVA